MTPTPHPTPTRWLSKAGEEPRTLWPTYPLRGWRDTTRPRPLSRRGRAKLIRAGWRRLDGRTLACWQEERQAPRRASEAWWLAYQNPGGWHGQPTPEAGHPCNRWLWVLG